MDPLTPTLKPMKRLIHIFFLTVFLSSGVLHLRAHTVRHFTNADGLSNSAILSICQSPDGLLWFGSCDGLNSYDGLHIRPCYFFDDYELSGNVIGSLVTNDNNDLWVATNYGIECIKNDSHEIKSYGQLRSAGILRKSDSGDIFVLSADNRVYAFNTLKDDFSQVNGYHNNGQRILSIFTFKEWLYIVTHDGINRFTIEYDSNGECILQDRELTEFPVSLCYYDDGCVFLVTHKGELFSFNLQENNILYLLDVSRYTSTRGAVSDVSFARDNSLFVGFRNNGVLRFSRNSENEYIPEDIGIRGGIFCLMRDKWQDVIWIGSDGQGIFAYANDNYSIRVINYSQIANSVTSPVRSLYLDKDNNLWIGTKGDGIVRVNDFDFKQSPVIYDFDRFTAQNSGLSNNLVYSYGESSHDIIWIGTEHGLNYYSFANKAIRPVPGGEKINYIHSIFEENDTTLWLASVGEGIYRASITANPRVPVLKDITKYTINNGAITHNYFFAMTHDEAGNFWFGNRGNGIFRLADGGLQPIPLHSDYPSNTINDVFSIEVTGDTLWVGTGNGLLMKSPHEEKLFSKSTGFPKSAIHGIERDPKGKLWVATNKGLVNLDVKTGHVITYEHTNGLDVTEFSDGASYSGTGMLFFGGINGIAVIQPSSANGSLMEFKPAVRFTRLTVNGKATFPGNHMGANGTLQFSPFENNLSFSFAAPDHINGGAYTYFYRLGETGEWNTLDSDNSISFNNMAYGDYLLQVKYFNPVLDAEGDIFSIKIKIDHPWYLSSVAKVLYLALGIILLLIFAMAYNKRIKRRQNHMLKDMERAHKEEIYEDKLRFFTNITHELCTPLTLIYGPCERILAYDRSDSYITKYAHLIKYNAERLNALIQEVIDFRRMETGHRKLTIQHIDISTLCNEVANSFSELAEGNHVTFLTDITPGIEWNTDKSSIVKILVNLVSNAFKYTPANGTVKLSVSIVNKNLTISVYNTGKGIAKEDTDKLFDRYRIPSRAITSSAPTMRARQCACSRNRSRHLLSPI